MALNPENRKRVATGEKKEDSSKKLTTERKILT
jgi:hypothetical protein